MTRRDAIEWRIAEGYQYTVAEAVADIKYLLEYIEEDKPMNERKYFIRRKDGFLYGYIDERDHAAGFLGDNGTPIKMTVAAAEKLFGAEIENYTLVPAK